jgi:membrane associated rhomboid family serine protease
MNIVAIIIMGITIVISIISFSNRELFYKLSFNPHSIEERKEWYRFFTYSVVHGDWMHLIFNMWVFYVFSDNVLDTFQYIFGLKGIYYFVLLYVGGVAFSVVKDYVDHRENPMYNAIGASGAVSAVLFSSIIIFPTDKLIFFPIPIPLPAYIMGILYLVFTVYMARRGKDNIGHTAHFLGAMYGIAFTIIIRPQFVGEFLSKLGF